MLLNNNEIQELLKVLDTHFIVFIGQNLGPEILTEEDKDLLRNYGINPDILYSGVPTYMQAFYFGKLAAALNKQNTDTLNYTDFLQYIKKGQYHEPTQKEKYVLEALKHQSYSAIKGLENRAKNDVSGIVYGVDMKYRQEYEEAIREATKKAILERKYVKDIVSEIGNKFQDWERDLGRVAETELQNSYQLGRAMEIEAQHGKDAKVYKTVYPGGCRHCIRLYLTEGIGSMPKIFKLSELIANGTNVGLKTDAWKPTISSTHPFCRCELSYISDSYEWNDEKKEFVPVLRESKKDRPKVEIRVGDKVFNV